MERYLRGQVGSIYQTLFVDSFQFQIKETKTIHDSGTVYKISDVDVMTLSRMLQGLRGVKIDAGVASVNLGNHESRI